MTPNYISNMSSDVSLWCNCEGSGNQWQDCLRLQRMFTHNTCLRESNTSVGLFSISYLQYCFQCKRFCERTACWQLFSLTPPTCWACSQRADTLGNGLYSHQCCDEYPKLSFKKVLQNQCHQCVCSVKTGAEAKWLYMTCLCVLPSYNKSRLSNNNIYNHQKLFYKGVWILEF